MFTPTFGDAGRRTVSDEAGDTVDSAKKQLRMVLAPMGSHGREGLAPSGPGGSSSGWVSSRPAMCAAGLACRHKADWRFERLQLLPTCLLSLTSWPRVYFPTRVSALPSLFYIFSSMWHHSWQLPHSTEPF